MNEANVGVSHKLDKYRMGESGALEKSKDQGARETMLRERTERRSEMAYHEKD